MATAYGASAGLAMWAAFRAGVWIFDHAVGLWCRRQDKQQQQRST